MARYHSRFGGLWPDRDDAPARIAQRRRDGALTAEQADLLRRWRRDGAVVLPGAVPRRLAAALARELEVSWLAERPELRATVHGYAGDRPVRLRRDLRDRPGAKLLDLHRVSRAARDALLRGPTAAFLRLLFGGQAPLLFQTLAFVKGSEQWFHQDTAYVVVDSPLELAAAWVALEDWRPGCGELRYFAGSHRLPETLFGGVHKAWSRDIHGQAAHDAWAASLPRRARAAGCPLRVFRPRRGDVLVWHADLAHGGAPVTDPAATRLSLVGHYCPADRRPRYWGPAGAPRRHGAGLWLSETGHG